MPEDLKRDIGSQQPLHQKEDISCVTYLTWALKSKSALVTSSHSILQHPWAESIDFLVPHSSAFAATAQL